MKKPIPTGEALYKYAQNLGISIDSDQLVNIPGSGTVRVRAPEHDVQKRVMEFERSHKGNWGLVITLISVVAAVATAVAAWVGVFRE